MQRLCVFVLLLAAGAGAAEARELRAGAAAVDISPPEGTPLAGYYAPRGSKAVLAPGMTFSNEPGIYIRGEFGIRCEDDMVITNGGPAQILSPSFQSSLEKPFG